MTSPNTPRSPWLSICIPTYNRPRQLDQCLTVLVEQCRPHGVTICVSDNASPAEVGRVIERHRLSYPFIDSRRNDTNVGMSANFVKVVELSRSEYSWLFSDDDAMVEGAVEKMIELCSRPDAEALIITNRRLMKPDLSEDIGARAENIASDDILNGGGGLLSRAAAEHYTYIPCLCFKTKLWQDTDPQRFADIPYFSHLSIIATFMADPGRRARICADEFMLCRFGQFSWEKQAGAVWFKYYPLAILRSEGYDDAARRQGIWPLWRKGLGPFALMLICNNRLRTDSLSAVIAAKPYYAGMGALRLWTMTLAAVLSTFVTPSWVWLAIKHARRLVASRQ